MVGGFKREASVDGSMVGCGPMTSREGGAAN